MGQEVADIAMSSGVRVAGFVDDRQELSGCEVLGLPVLGDGEWLEDRDLPVFVAVGAPATRRRVCERLGEAKVEELPALVHPTAYVGLGCELGAGSVIAASATLT